MQGFHLEYLRYGDSDKPAGRGKKHGTMDRLLRLANDATLREELTSFPLAPDAEDAIPAVHRSGMLPSGMLGAGESYTLNICTDTATQGNTEVPSSSPKGGEFLKPCAD